MKWDKDKIGYSVRTDRFRYNKWYDLMNANQVMATELYDHQSDPLETKNLAGQHEYTSVQRYLESLLNTENQLIVRYGK